ncbi:O-antigen ligase family protein [Acidobacteriota bacterium]
MRILFVLFALSLAVALNFFYLKYVPLISGYQLALAPILFAVFACTAFSRENGTLLFIFLFPLINNLPYFFGIYENTPHAPAALIMFLFFFLGWMCHSVFFKKPFAATESIFKPMVIVSVLFVLSAIITVFKFNNFFPFLADSVYELITNVNGVTSGGAVMSVVFTSLNYLSGFVFFFILVNTIKSKDNVRTIIILFMISFALALIFGVYQHLDHLELGNTPKWIEKELINSTFKTPLAFGAFLSALIPVIIGVFLAFKGLIRVFSLSLFVLAIYFLPQTSSRSSLGAVIIALLFMSFFILTKAQIKASTSRRIISSLLILLVLFILVFSAFVTLKESTLYRRFSELKRFYDSGGIGRVLGIRLDNRWKMAVRMMNEYPLSGVGVGAYIIELPNYVKLADGAHEITDSAENYVLQVGSEMGLFGLFFALWIFLEIIRAISRSLGQNRAVDRWRFIQIGISCGVIALFFNFIFHTYIGSYEIKYTFWLLVGLLFILGKGKEGVDRQAFSGKKIIVLASVVIISFGLIHVWNSTHSLSLKSRTERFGLRQNFGLYPLERTENGNDFFWTREYGGVALRVEGPFIDIPLHASHPDIKENPVRVEVYLVKDLFQEMRLLDEIVISANIWQSYSYTIPEEVGQEIILLVKVNRTWNPQKIKGTPDPRNLGVAIGRIQFRHESGQK